MIYNEYLMGFINPYFIPRNTIPPTLYSIMESIVNYGKSERIKTSDLAKNSRTEIFDFDYPLTNNISKEKFETMILNHFIMRRIGYETLTAFKIQLNVKLNEIMPIYNKMFDSFENWDLFNDGETTTKIGTDNRNINTSNKLENISETESSNIADHRNSELPQNRLEDLRSGDYVTDYNYNVDTNKSKDNTNSNGISESKDINNYEEIVKRSQTDKITIYKEMQENIKSIYTMIFKDLECLFYQIVI